LRQTENAYYCPVGFADNQNGNGDIQPGHWRALVRNNSSSLLSDLKNVRRSRYSDGAIDVRNSLKEYVNSPDGCLSWQLDHVRRT